MRTLEQFEAETNADSPTFWLGRYVATHRIGDYALVEYQPWVDIDRARRDRGLQNTSHYLLFDGGRDLGHTAPSLDLALITLLALKYDGRNTRAMVYIPRMLGMEATE